MDELGVDVRDSTGVITLNRPERLNALTHSMVGELRSRLHGLGDDPAVRAIVLTGAGRAFSAGADLRGGPSDAEAVLRDLYNPLVTTMLELEAPIIAAVNGVAAGAGASLAAACDLRVADQSASFQCSFVKVGLVPDAGATWILPRLVGPARAAEMMLLGRPVTAPEALRWGLVNEVVPDGNSLERATELATALAELSSTVGTTKRALRRGLTSDLPNQLEHEAQLQGRAQKQPDHQEARRAFLEKRPPRFARTTAA